MYETCGKKLFWRESRLNYYPATAQKVGGIGPALPSSPAVLRTAGRREPGSWLVRPWVQWEGRGCPPRGQARGFLSDFYVSRQQWAGRALTAPGSYANGKPLQDGEGLRELETRQVSHITETCLNWVRAANPSARCGCQMAEPRWELAESSPALSFTHVPVRFLYSVCSHLIVKSPRTLIKSLTIASRAFLHLPFHQTISIHSFTTKILLCFMLHFYQIIAYLSLIITFT